MLSDLEFQALRVPRNLKEISTWTNVQHRDTRDNDTIPLESRGLHVSPNAIYDQ